MKYYVQVSNRMVNDNYISNLKGEIVFSINFWKLFLFCEILSEGSIVIIIIIIFFIFIKSDSILLR